MQACHDAKTSSRVHAPEVDGTQTPRRSCGKRWTHQSLSVSNAFSTNPVGKRTPDVGWSSSGIKLLPRRCILSSASLIGALPRQSRTYATTFSVGLAVSALRSKNSTINSDASRKSCLTALHVTWGYLAQGSRPQVVQQREEHRSTDSTRPRRSRIARAPMLCCSIAMGRLLV